MGELDVNKIAFVASSTGTFAIYNDVYYKINNSTKIVIEELQNGNKAEDIAAKFQVKEEEITNLLAVFKQKGKASIIGKIVLFPKMACNYTAAVFQYLIGNKTIMLFVLLSFAISCYYVFNFSSPVDSLSISQAFLIFFSILFWHELGHIAAAYKNGIKDLQIRLGFYLIFPVTHVDMNSIYTLSNRQRLLIDMGGLYFQMVLGIVFCLLSLITDSAIYTFAFTENLMVIIYNLLPYQISDGHWIYSDYFGIDNLNRLSRECSKSWIRVRREEKPNTYTVPVKCYSIFNTIFVSLLTVYSIVILFFRSFTISQIYDNLILSHFAINEVLKACWLLYPYGLLLIFLFVKINAYTKYMVKGNH